MARRIGIDEADFPPCLRELDDPPAALHVEGELPALARAVAIVGTRRVDASGVRFARELARDLARAGCAIISGGAHGIDTAAHEGALDAGGATVVVLPGTLDAPYPARNRALFATIARTGALLSEYDVEPARFPSLFLGRNRLIAALAQLTIVVQAPARSGALSTAAHARRLGRGLMAVPSAPWEVRGEGCLTLLASGAKLCRGSADVLAEIAPEALPVRVPRRTRKTFEDGDQELVYKALAQGPDSPDTLCERTGLAAPRVQRALLMLLLAGDIEELGVGRYALGGARPRS